jgi:hypothetical protein
LNSRRTVLVRPTGDSLRYVYHKQISALDSLVGYGAFAYVYDNLGHVMSSTAPYQVTTAFDFDLDGQRWHRLQRGLEYKGRPGAGNRSQHLAGFAFDINSSMMTAAQNSQFSALAMARGFMPLRGDPGHYQAIGGAQAVYRTHAAGVAEAARSEAAGECVDANVQATRNR